MNWVVNRLVPSTNAAEKWASSESDPSRLIDTIASTPARRSGSSARLALRNAGKSMKFVPMALTYTPFPATSAATFRPSMLAAARPEEYSGAPGVGRAPAALVKTRTCPSPCSSIAGTTSRRKL